jgi:hypothetical protein
MRALAPEGGVSENSLAILPFFWRVASVSTPKNHTEGAPGPLLLGTGETPDLN